MRHPAERGAHAPPQRSGGGSGRGGGGSGSAGGDGRQQRSSASASTTRLATPPRRGRQARRGRACPIGRVGGRVRNKRNLRVRDGAAGRGDDAAGPPATQRPRVGLWGRTAAPPRAVCPSPRPLPRGRASCLVSSADTPRPAPARRGRSELLRLVACRANCFGWWRAERTPPACTHLCARFRTDQDVQPSSVKFTTFKIMTETFCACICEAACATLTQTRARLEPITTGGS